MANHRATPKFEWWLVSFDSALVIVSRTNRHQRDDWRVHVARISRFENLLTFCSNGRDIPYWSRSFSIPSVSLKKDFLKKKERKNKENRRKSSYLPKRIRGEKETLSALLFNSLGQRWWIFTLQIRRWLSRWTRQNGRHADHSRITAGSPTFSKDTLLCPCFSHSRLDYSLVLPRIIAISVFFLQKVPLHPDHRGFRGKPGFTSLSTAPFSDYYGIFSNSLCVVKNPTR